MAAVSSRSDYPLNHAGRHTELLGDDPERCTACLGQPDGLCCLLIEVLPSTQRLPLSVVCCLVETLKYIAARLVFVMLIPPVLLPESTPTRISYRRQLVSIHATHHAETRWNLEVFSV